MISVYRRTLVRYCTTDFSTIPYSAASLQWNNTCRIPHMTTSRKKLGNRGEALAEAYLRQQGYKIVRRNYRWGRGELDLICRHRDDLVVVEIKSLRSTGWGAGEERISRRQQNMIIRTTYAFIEQNRQFSGLGVRFDLVVIDYSSFPAQIRHHKGAFWQGMT